MFEKDGRIISLEEAQGAANRKGMSVEEWANEFGFTNSEGEPKKTNDSAVSTNDVRWGIHFGRYFIGAVRSK